MLSGGGGRSVDHTLEEVCRIADFDLHKGMGAW